MTQIIEGPSKDGPLLCQAQPERIIVVAGVSTAGKSTFIHKLMTQDFSRVRTNVHWVRHLSEKFDLADDRVSFVHYDLYFPKPKPFHLFRPSLWAAALNKRIRFETETVYRQLRDHEASVHLYLLYCPKAELRHRIENRKTNEPLLTGHVGHYEIRKNLRRFHRYDQKDLLVQFGQGMKAHVDQLHLLNSETEAYDPMCFDSFAQDLTTQ